VEHRELDEEGDPKQTFIDEAPRPDALLERATRPVAT